MATRGGGFPSFPCSHLGVAKPVLLPVHIDGVQKLLRSIFTVDKLPFWNGTGIEDPVPEEGAWQGQFPGPVRSVSSWQGGAEGPLAAQPFPEGCTLLLTAQACGLRALQESSPGILQKPRPRVPWFLFSLG